MEDIAKLQNKLSGRFDPKYGKILFYIVLGFYLSSQFLNGTMFIIYFPDTLPYRLWMVAGVLALTKIILFNKFKDEQEILIFVMLGLLLLVGCMLSQSWDFIYYYLMIVAAKDIDFRTILKEFLIIIVVGLLFTIISAKLGWIMGLTNSRDGSVEIRYALGTVFPTDLAARLFYVMLFYAVYKKFRFTLPEYISMVALTVWSYTITDTRLDVLLMILTILCGVFRNVLIKVIQLLQAKWLSLFSLLAIFMIIIMTYLYSPSNLVFKILNKALSGRLGLGKTAFERYNVQIFGQFVVQNGNGGIHHGPFDYFFIDCSFLKILMMNGLVGFIVLLCGIMYLTKRFMVYKAYTLELALLFVIVSSLIDHHLLEISYNVLFLAFFADIKYFIEKD